jgi:uncharacterized protein YggU (UPF0235/DUF167 family)
MGSGVDLALHVTPRARGVTCNARSTPRARRNAIEGVDAEGRLRLRVSAAPVDGAANEAVVALLAAELDVRRGAVTLTAGATGRHKRCHVEGLQAAPLLLRWPGLQVRDGDAG